MASGVVLVSLNETGREPEDLGVFDFQRISIMEAIQLKARTGLTPKQMVDGLAEMDPQSMQALVWMLRVRKGGAAGDPHQINFTIGDLKLVEEPDPTEETSGVDGASTSVSSPTSAT